MKPSGRKNVKKRLIGMGRHLVYSEGTKTEIFYANNIKNHIKEDANHINVLIPVKYSRTKHTCELIDRVELDVKKRRKNNEFISGIWILFDKDSFEDFKDACSIINSKNQKRNDDGEMADDFGTVWHCVPSVQCFEVWYYLHFEDLTVGIERKAYIKKINEFIKRKGFAEQYKKNRENPYDWIKSVGGDVDAAIKRAKKKAPLTDPSTEVYKFVEFFQAYFEV